LIFSLTRLARKQSLAKIALLAEDIKGLKDAIHTEADLTDESTALK